MPYTKQLWRLALCLAFLSFTGILQAQSGKAPPRNHELEEAVRSVKHRTRGQILSAKTHRGQQRSYHKIRVLTPDGRVKNMRLPARNSGRHQPAHGSKQDDERRRHHP